MRTRKAIQTDGRSEAARVAQFDDPAMCVMLGADGYLPARRCHSLSGDFTA